MVRERGSDSALSRNRLRDDLRDRILGGEFRAGDLLPSERSLVETSGLSRGSVREAIRSLEVEGLIETNRGRFGGSRVIEPRRDRLVHLVDIFVRAKGVSLASMLDCRAAIEPMMARLAARNMTPAALARLEELNQAFHDNVGALQDYRRINYEWHLEVARIGGNEPLMALLEPILNLARDSTEYERVTTPPNRLRAIAAHDEVMAALRTGDEAGAALAMEAHLISYARLTRDSEG
ncbi:MAG: FadR family transcriptional regulator [Pseudooceanicola sp.]|nr:FadR family transcriptional regulator [Pseudooceanicola sp.]